MGANLISGLGGSVGFGTTAMARGDDVSGSVTFNTIFENGLTLFGQTFSSLVINNNGSVTFGGPRFGLENGLAAASGLLEIAPFLADVDTRVTTTNLSPGGTSTGSNRVYYSLDTANDRLIITWDDVGYFDRQNDKVNAFQLVLTDRGSAGDFDIEFRYENIDWTKSTLANGPIAQAGVSAGLGIPGTYLQLPGSGDNAAMLALDSAAGNTGESGRWLFNIRSTAVFGETQDVVDFTNLLPTQADNILDGAQYTNAGGGNDVVRLPDLGFFTIGSTTIWDFQKTFDGGAGNDTIIGGNFHDIILGATGDDLIFGGLGQDVLRGGAGNDTLVGGTSISGDGLTSVPLNDGRDVALYEKSRDSYKVESVGGHFVVTDLATGDVDHLYNIEYLIFGQAADLDYLQVDNRIAQYFDAPYNHQEVYRLPYVYLDFANPIQRSAKVIDLGLLGFDGEYVVLGSGSEGLGNFTHAQKNEIVQGVQAIFDRSGIEITVVAGQPPAGEAATSVLFSNQKIFYDHDGDPDTAEVQFRGSTLFPLFPDLFNESLDDDVAVFMDGYRTDGTTPLDSAGMQRLINTIAHELGHSFGLAHAAIATGSNVMDRVDTTSERFSNAEIDVEFGPGGSFSFPSTQNAYYSLNRHVVGVNANGVTPGGVDLKQVQAGFDEDTVFSTILGVILPLVNTVFSLFVQIVGSGPTALTDEDAPAPLVYLGDTTAGVQSGFNFSILEGQAFRILGASAPGGPIDSAMVFNTPNGPTMDLIAGQTQPLSANLVKYTARGVGSTVGTAQFQASVATIQADLPDAVEDTTQVAEDGSVTIDVLANDAVRTPTITAVSDPANGTTVITQNGRITYTPDVNYNGQDGAVSLM